MTLQEKIKVEMTEAMKNKNEVRLMVLRGLVTLFTQELTATKRTPQDTLQDDEVLGLIRRSLKQRREAAKQFRTGNREDLAKSEDEEAKILETYLPKMMDKEEIMNVAKEQMKALGVKDKSGMGKLMGAVMGELKGKADGSDVKVVIDSILS